MPRGLRISPDSARRLARATTDRERRPPSPAVPPRRASVQSLGPYAFVAQTGAGGITANSSGTVTKLLMPSQTSAGTITAHALGDDVGASKKVVCLYCQGTDGLYPVVIFELCDTPP